MDPLGNLHFSPLFDATWFWRAEMPEVETGDYGPLEDLARNKVNLTKVTTHWPDMLRVTGSLVTGQVRQAYRTGQEEQLGALGLVLNAAALWTTRYLDAAVDHLRALPPEAREHDVLDEDVAPISPLKHANLNCLGRYSFAARPPQEGLRPASGAGARLGYGARRPAAAPCGPPAAGPPAS